MASSLDVQLGPAQRTLQALRWLLDLLFTVPAAMALLPRVDWSRADLARVGRAFLLLQALLLGICISPHRRAPAQEWFRSCFSSVALAAHGAALARRLTDRNRRQH